MHPAPTFTPGIQTADHVGGCEGHSARRRQPGPGLHCTAGKDGNDVTIKETGGSSRVAKLSACLALIGLVGFIAIRPFAQMLEELRDEYADAHGDIPALPFRDFNSFHGEPSRP